MGTGDILQGGNPPVQGGVAILLGLLHATETGIQPCGPLPTFPPSTAILRGGGGVVVVRGGNQTPYLFIDHFLTKKVPLLCNLLLINGTLFMYLV